MDYIRNETYVRIFDAQVLRVFLANIPGMLYMSAHSHNGYDVYFGMREEELVIRAQKGLQILELVPHYKFVDDLPTALVTDYVHWLDIATREIELRPLNKPFQSDLENWKLRYQPGRTSNLLLTNRKLIDIRSKTCGLVMDVFGPLETIEHVHVTLSNHQRLEVALPRYDLRFFLNHDGDFQCYELDKIVDSDQSVGTLIGLKSRLVLSGIPPLARKHDRILLIPGGQVSLAQGNPHVEAIISVPGPDVRLFQYQIDATLHRLQGDRTLFSTVYKAYLHAITSSILPDPFTGCTGTEEAISILRHRSLGLIKPPDDKTIDVLTKIAALTPRREFNPESLKVMQKVKWHKTLSMLAQHDDFLPLAEQIITSGDRYVIFYPQATPADSLCRRRDVHLLQRARIQSSCFRGSDFGGGIDVRSYDSKYEARDLPKGTRRGSRSFEIASLVRDWPKELEVSEDLNKEMQSYGMVSGFGTAFDVASPISELLDFRFSTSWAPLHELCRTRSRDNDTCLLLFLFGMIAYGEKIRSLTALRTLLAFAFVPKLRKIPVPTGFSHFELRKGTTLDEEVLEKIILRKVESYAGLGKRKNPTEWNAEKEKYDAHTKKQAKDVLAKYRRQWPCKEPQTPWESLSDHLDLVTASRTISGLFYILTANRKYQKYFKAVQKILDHVYLKSSALVYTSKDWHLLQKPRSIHPSRLLPSLSGLMTGNAPASSSKQNVLKLERTLNSTQRNEKLRTLIAEIHSHSEGNNHQSIRKQYRDDLLASYDSFSNYKEQANPQRLPHPLTETVLNRLTCESKVSENLKVIQDVIGPNNPTSRLLELGGLWPRLTIRSLLANLSTRSSTSLTRSWRDCLLTLGESVTVLQRARRLILAGERNDVSAFCAEIENEGHQGWDTDQWPDWLLIEIEGDFLIRPTQAHVALEMIQPSSSENSLVQLNMGRSPLSDLTSRIG